MDDYSYIQGNQGHLDLIRPLWDKLNAWHYDQADSFIQRFRNVDWDKSKREMIDDSAVMLVDYVLDQANNRNIGFCISRVYKNDRDIGEIDSLYVEEDHRQAGIGKKLMERAIQWLDEQGAEKKRVLVVAGNEPLIEYYSQFGFQPLHIVLQRKDQKKDAR